MARARCDCSCHGRAGQTPPTPPAPKAAPAPPALVRGTPRTEPIAIFKEPTVEAAEATITPLPTPPAKSYECHCGRTFTSPQALGRHRSWKHDTTKPKPATAKPAAKAGPPPKIKSTARSSVALVEVDGRTHEYATRDEARAAVAVLADFGIAYRVFTLEEW